MPDGAFPRSRKQAAGTEPEGGKTTDKTGEQD